MSATLNRVTSAAANAAAEGMKKMPSADSIVHNVEEEIEHIPNVIGRMLRPHSPFLANVVEAIHIDSPFTIMFIFTCFMVHLINTMIPGDISSTYFAVPPFAFFYFTSPVSWWTLFSHTLGHGSWSHLNGNVVNLLLVAPPCERHYGALNTLKIIFYVALASGLAHMLLGPANTAQLGASGVVFAFILLNSLIEIGSEGSTGLKGKIPLTFLCQIFLWCWNEIASQVLGSDNGVSHIAHLVGAVVGVVAGFKLNPKLTHLG